MGLTNYWIFDSFHKVKLKSAITDGFRTLQQYKHLSFFGGHPNAILSACNFDGAVDRELTSNGVEYLLVCTRVCSRALLFPFSMRIALSSYLLLMSTNRRLRERSGLDCDD